jgi:DNA-binding IclR family transcriptional regulator
VHVGGATCPELSPRGNVDGEIVPNKPKQQVNKPVAAAERAFLILEAFRPGDAFLSLDELSQRTNLYKSTILRLIQTPLNLHYISRNSSGLYAIGPAAIRLASLYTALPKSEEAILSTLSQLVEATGETASYSIRRGDLRVYLYRVNASRRLRDNIQPGDITQLGKGATGKILRAFSKPFDRKYEFIRQSMFAYSAGEMEKGMVGISSPVFDHEGNLSGAVSLSGPDSRLGEREITHARALLLGAAKNITMSFGGRGDMYEKAEKAIPFASSLRISGR